MAQSIAKSQQSRVKLVVPQGQDSVRCAMLDNPQPLFVCVTADDNQLLFVADLTLKGCSPPFRHTHHHVRKELHSLWLKGEVGDSLLLQRTLLKLTSKSLSQTRTVMPLPLIERQIVLSRPCMRCTAVPLLRTIVNAGLSWSKAYETISNAFVYSSDCTALDLKTDYICSLPQDRSPTAEANNIWQSVLQVWQEYRTWVTRVCSLCTRLVECISAERAAEMMSRGKADTPTLFDMGKAAFRSQVCYAQLDCCCCLCWQQAVI